VFRYFPEASSRRIKSDVLIPTIIFPIQRLQGKLISQTSGDGMRVQPKFTAFEFVFVPLLVIGLALQLAVAWSQRKDLAAGYFDFVLYYSGAKIINDGKGPELFKLDLQREYQKEFGVAKLNLDVPFNHAPYELLIFLPLAHLSYPVAHFIWSLLNVFLVLRVLQRLIPFVDPKHMFVYGLMLFAFFPAMMALKMGQDSVLSTFLFTETFVSLKRQRDATAGAILALGLYKPQLVLPLVGILLFNRRWKFVSAFALAGAVLLALSLALVGWRGALDLAALWLSMSDRGHIIWPELMINLRGLFYIILDPAGLATATNFLTLVASAALYLGSMALWREPATDGMLFDLRLSLGVVVTVLVSFHLYSYDASILLIPLILLLHYVMSDSIRSTAARRIIPFVMIALYIPLLPNVLLSRFALAWGTVPILLLYVALALEIRRHTGNRLLVNDVRPSASSVLTLVTLYGGFSTLTRMGDEVGGYE
jgi:hypothetical protein